MLGLMPAEMLRLMGEFQRFAKIFRLTFMESSAIKKKKGSSLKEKERVRFLPIHVLFYLSLIVCAVCTKAVQYIRLSDSSVM